MSPSLLPIRKVAVAAIVALLLWVAPKLGVSLGEGDAAQAAEYVVILVAAYLTPDPRVK